MKYFFKQFFFGFLYCTIGINVYGQVKFIATINPSIAAKEEYLTLKLSIINAQNIQQITPPNLSDFTLISGPNQESTTNTINGLVTQSVSFIFILQAKKLGNFLIPSTAAFVDGKTLQSNAVKVNINKEKSNKPSQSSKNTFTNIDFFDNPKPKKQYPDYILKDGESIQKKLAANIFLKIITSKKTCYVGEPILATYKLFTRLPCESNLTKNPSFNGFSVIDMMQDFQQNNNEHEMLNGREYSTYLIRKAQLYPLQSGEIMLETAALNNKITLAKYDKNGFGNLQYENTNVESSSIPITVKPLPIKGKPESFSGAVGDFTIESSIEKNIFSTDETGKLTITISGKGNMQLITLPSIDWGNTVEIFETKSQDNLDYTSMPLSGSKIFEIPFSINKEGAYSIPSITFSFFNPSSSSYNSISTKSIAINILKNSKNSIKQKTENQLVKSNKNAPFTSNFFVPILLAVGSIFIVVLIFFKKKKNKVFVNNASIINTTIPNEEKNIDTKDYLKNTALAIQNDIPKKQFLATLNNELKYFLAERFSVNINTINGRTIENIVTEKTKNAGLATAIRLIFIDLEQYLYSPSEVEISKQQWYDKANEIMKRIG